MIKIIGIYLAVMLTTILIGTRGINAQSDQRATVMERQALMKSMLKSYFPLLAVYKGKSTDLTKAGEAALKLKDDMAKSIVLFPEGTAKDQVPGSRARPEIWSEANVFEAAANAVISSVGKLIEISASGEVEAFKMQFSLVEQACLGCHEFKPSGGGKFRFAK